MAQLIQNIVDGYNDLMENHSDPRVKDWFLMGSVFPTLWLCIAYVIGVKIVGPKLMENRKAYDLRNTIIVYNIFQVLYNVRLIIWGLEKDGPYSDLKLFECNYIDESPAGIPCAKFFWYFYFLKITEFLDTIFFVLRKKNNQVSTLHVIHHGIMPLMTWIIVKFVPGGAVSLGGYLNSIVHVVMYTYYILAAMGPQMQKYLWWKKYLTTMQIVQFVILMVHSLVHFFILKCNYNTLIFMIPGSLGFMFFFMFADFYKKAYIKKKPNAVQKERNGTDTRSPNNVFSKSNNANRDGSEETSVLRNRAGSSRL